MSEQITPIGQEQLAALPEEGRVVVEKFEKEYDLSIYHVRGGVWNQHREETRRQTGNVGVYIVVGEEYKDSSGRTRTPQRFYHVGENGFVKINDDEVVRAPDGSFVGYQGQMDFKNILKEKPQDLNVAANLVNDDKGRVTGLSFIRVAPKGQELKAPAIKIDFSRISFKK